MILGISHITFIVKDLNLAKLFFESIFDAKEVYSSEDKFFSLSKEKFFLINDIWIAVMEGCEKKEKAYNHVAFKIKEEDVKIYLEKIEKLGVHILPQRKRIEGEGASIYFYDFDNNLFELHTGNLKDRLKSYESST